MTSPVTESGRPPGIDSRKKATEKLAHELFYKQLKRSPFCVPEKNAERHKQLSNAIFYIQKSLDQALKNIDALEEDLPVTPPEVANDAPRGLEGCDVTPLSCSITCWCPGTEPLGELSCDVIQDLLSRARIQREKVGKLQELFQTCELSASGVREGLRDILEAERECNQKLNSLQERVNLLPERLPFPSGNTLEEELQRVTTNTTRFNLIARSLANSVRYKLLVCREIILRASDAMRLLWKLLIGRRCIGITWSLLLANRNADLPLAIGLLNLISPHDKVISWRNWKVLSFLVGVVIAAIASFATLYILLRSPRGVTPPTSFPVAESQGRPLSSEEAFWIAMQAA